MAKKFDLDSTPPADMLRDEYACDDGWIENFLESAEIGHVATLWDNQPFITPTTFWFNPGTREIYFHSNIVGRIRANIENFPKVCFEASRPGELLPSNIALEFSIQYESVVVFGQARLLEDDNEKRCALEGLIRKYFPEMQPGKHYRPITDKELKRTSVYKITVESWSGKRNWPDEADQDPDWKPDIS